MLPAAIQHYVRPRTIADALTAVADTQYSEAMFLAGGQSAMQAIKARILRPDCIIDLQDIDELRGIRADSDGLNIGAMTRYVEIAEHAELGGAYAALGDAAARVGDRQVRNRGTIGGSICWNYVASCMPAVVLGLGGIMHLTGAGTSRAVPADDFFLGPLDTVREEHEILASISWPAAAPRSGSAYKKWGLVTDALPVVGVCIAVSLDEGGKCVATRMALSGLSDGAQRCPVGESALSGCDGSTSAIAAAMDAAANATATQSDHTADAEYRKQLIRTLGAEVAATAFARAGE